ncbi:hypothetical protein CAXC1_330084 [Candidatus Xenohaliotis californiensis]|uniref:Uncharacterized protein n=1 Tax=Candidatus Xenohaliotis californiensis TaxID=84677 RepID=A0ABP0ETI1_9RICK|nr:hypothetical protein CAXC1_330084 [Candidatus Xenohaliotis californiensis]
MAKNKTYSRVETASSGNNHIGKKIVLLGADNKRITSLSTEDTKKLIRANIKSLTISNTSAAKQAFYSILDFNKDEKLPISYKKHHSPGIKALHDLIAPAVYDITIPMDNPSKPDITPIGSSIENNNKTYRFNLYDIAKNDFSNTGMPIKEGVVVAGDETGIKTTINETGLVITLNGPSLNSSIKDKIKHPLQTIMQLRSPKNSRNLEWIKTLNETSGAEQKVNDIPRSQEKSYQFTITEKSLREMPMHERVVLIHKLSSSVEAVREIDNNLKPLLLLSKAKEMQQNGLLLPFKALNLVYKTITAILAVTVASTGGSEPNLKQKVLKPLRIIAEMLNLQNLPTVLSSLGSSGKALYLISKPLGMLPVVGSLIDTAIVKALCKREIKSRTPQYIELEKQVRLEAQNKTKDNPKSSDKSKQNDAVLSQNHEGLRLAKPSIESSPSWTKNEQQKQQNTVNKTKESGPEH